MRPLKLSIKNFMNHKKTEVDLSSFKSALIVGKTKKNDRISNGVGKTTVYSAIEYCLFNKVHKANLDTVVRDGAKKCVVELEFEAHNQKYKILRGRTQKGAADLYLYHWLDDQWKSVTQRTPSETENKIKSIIKLSHKAFEYSVLFRQTDLNSLSENEKGDETAPKARKEILKEPLNLIRYSKKEKIVAERAKPIKEKIGKVESVIAMLGDPENDIKASEDFLFKLEKDIKTKENAIKNELLVTIDNKRKLLFQLQGQLNSKDAKIHLEISNTEKKIKELNDNIHDQNINLKNIEDKISSIKENVANKKKIIKEKNFQIKELLFDPADLQKLEEKLKKISADEQKGVRLIAKKEQEIETIQNKTHLEAGKCPTCEQDVTDNHIQKLQALNDETVIKLQNSLDKLNVNLNKCSLAKNNIEKNIRKKRNDQIEIAKLNNSISALAESINEKNIQIKEFESQIEKINKDINDKAKILDESRRLFASLKDSISSTTSFTDLNNKIFALESEIKIYEESLESMRLEISNLKSKQGSYQQKISTRKEDLVKLNERKTELESLRKELKLHQLAGYAFSHKGIPTFIINTCLDELQRETNQTLQELRPDLEVEFDADLNFTYRRNGKVRAYHQLSHGQHVYIALSFKRGLSRVIQHKMNIDINFLLFDEVDSNLDEEGLDAFINAIKKWQSENLILVITHNKYLKEKFSHAILVEEGDDGSEGRLVTTW